MQDEGHFRCRTRLLRRHRHRSLPCLLQQFGHAKVQVSRICLEHVEALVCAAHVTCTEAAMHKPHREGGPPSRARPRMSLKGSGLLLAASNASKYSPIPHALRVGVWSVNMWSLRWSLPWTWSKSLALPPVHAPSSKPPPPLHTKKTQAVLLQYYNTPRRTLRTRPLVVLGLNYNLCTNRATSCSRSSRATSSGQCCWR